MRSQENSMELRNCIFGIGNNITVFIESKIPSIIKYIPILGLKYEKCVINLMKYCIKMLSYIYFEHPGLKGEIEERAYWAPFCFP